MQIFSDYPDKNQKYSQQDINEIFMNTIGGISYLVLKELVKRNGVKFEKYEKEIIEIILEYKSKSRVTKGIKEVAYKISKEINNN